MDEPVQVQRLGELSREDIVNAPQAGEFAWHAFTGDPTVDTESLAHLERIERALGRHGKSARGLRFLEVGAYRHYTGYLAEARWGAEVTLTDIAASSLRAGRDAAQAAAVSAAPTLVAADFHDLPFADNRFDTVFIASAVHHTHRPRVVLRELMRVLAPGGLLILDNEPCARLACFHKFSSNRPELHTPLEHFLHDRHLLTWVSSPFPGSRPEALFGMVENDRIPAQLFRDELGAHGEILEWHMDRGTLEHELERELVAMSEKGVKLEQAVADRLRAALTPAAAHLGAVDALLGFSLPGDAEIAQLAARLAPELEALRRSRDPEGDRSRLFGAALRAVVRKRGERRAGASGTGTRRPLQQRDGIWHECDEGGSVATLFDAPMLPDVYEPRHQAEVAQLLRAEDWTPVIEASGLLSWLNVASTSRIALSRASSGVLLIRFYGTVENENPFTLRTCIGTEVLDEQVVALNESRLVRAWLPAGDGDVTLALTNLDESAHNRSGALRVGVVQFLPVRAEPVA